MSPRTVGNLLLVAAAVPAVASVAIYAPAGWWRSRWGRHVMTYMASVALVLSLSTLRIVIGDSPAFFWVRTGAFAIVTVALWWRLALLIQALREKP